MNGWMLLGLLGVATAVGYALLREVPSLLHTPLMSGMNALSGITILGSLQVLGRATATGDRLLAAAAVVLAAFNVVGGYVVTQRMLQMFHQRE